MIGQHSEWLSDWRARAGSLLPHAIWPTRKLEAWRYADLRGVAPLKELGPTPDADEAQARRLMATIRTATSPQIVVVNGRLSAALSTFEPSGDGIQVVGLMDAMARWPDAVQASLGTLASSESDAFTALNSSLFLEGLFIYVPPNFVVETPIDLLFLSVGATDERFAVHPRVLIYGGRSSQATIIERYAGSETQGYFTNAVTEVSLEANAHLCHVRVQNEGAQARHVGRLVTRQEADSRLESHVYSLGASTSRLAIESNLSGAGAELILNGLYVGAGSQRHDHYTCVDHRAGHCSSTELYKGILDHKSVGSFQGRALVQKYASGSRIAQLNKNLLLSPDARANTKPQLEIDHDDVVAAHGATVGQLDVEALFYLRSRGIDPLDARRIMVMAFANEIPDLLGPTEIGKEVVEMISLRLGAPLE